jgi:hypothetical protein
MLDADRHDVDGLESHKSRFTRCDAWRFTAPVDRLAEVATSNHRKNHASAWQRLSSAALLARCIPLESGRTKQLRWPPMRAVTPLWLKRRAASLATWENGAGLTESLAKTQYFPGVALQMMRTGEESGNLDAQLDKVADFLEQDAETTIRQSVKVLGIVVFLAIAAYIGAMVVQFYVGYFNQILSATGE